MLKRVVASMLRYVNNSKLAGSHRKHASIQITQLQTALNVLIKLCQSEAFSQELRSLQSKQPLKTNSSILSLNPFLDEVGISRVGGRIQNSCYPFNKKFPVLLSKEHPLTKLIFKCYHEQLLHCSAQQLFAVIRESYWSISVRSRARSITHNCIKCFRASPRSHGPLMDDLSAKRLQAASPVCSRVGVDYAGPILIENRKFRGSKLIKTDICLFVCLVTKAIHLELVTSLTTDAFLVVLKRFIGRRDKPISMSSDNATNFRVAANELRELYTFLHSNENHISSFTSNEGVKWDLIVPKSPHQGGKWESGIKSVRTHLKRILGNTSLAMRITPHF
ncbi:hypothetical protein ILUMI_07842 [Ignelater luminosus]|uniref:Integrase catalytic domain-containing protein n=1 Tax=Ignelater luminosus TaxID=2038154 RepID=A0A8K0D809_IGNLU|nr:hypothetical protein ILUMI_07842 [Ignelater luminosus]